MTGIFIEVTGTQCSGKTSVARAFASMYGARYVAVEAEECWEVWDRGRQYCFLAVMGAKWFEAVSLAAVGGRVIVDHSLLGIAGYSDFFGDTRTAEHASRAWLAGRRMLRKIKAKHLLVILTASPEVLRERCSSRGRSVSGWEAETAGRIQDAILERAARTASRGYLVIDTTYASIPELARSLASRIGL